MFFLPNLYSQSFRVHNKIIFSRSALIDSVSHICRIKKKILNKIWIELKEFKPPHCFFKKIKSLEVNSFNEVSRFIYYNTQNLFFSSSNVQFGRNSQKNCLNKYIFASLRCSCFLLHPNLFIAKSWNLFTLWDSAVQCSAVRSLWSAEHYRFRGWKLKWEEWKYR